MDESLPVIYLARHGETAWTITGQHTGRTDLPLTPAGEQSARYLAERLASLSFARVFTSPLQRARRTCTLAGFESVADVDPNLVEWDYGQYEGLRGVEIRKENPGWHLFRDGCPGGESPAQATARAAEVVRRARAVEGNVLLFSSGHFLRTLAAVWIGVDPAVLSMSLLLSTASVSVLGYDRQLSRPVIRLWNETRHSG